MKTFLLVLSLFGFALLADGQTLPVSGGPIEVLATTITRAGNRIQLRGNVRVNDGSSVITADEAEVPVAGSVANPPDIQLRGNVRVVFAGHRPAQIHRQ